MSYTWERIEYIWEENMNANMNIFLCQNGCVSYCLKNTSTHSVPLLLFPPTITWTISLSLKSWSLISFLKFLKFALHHCTNIQWYRKELKIILEIQKMLLYYYLVHQVFSYSWSFVCPHEVLVVFLCVLKATLEFSFAH